MGERARAKKIVISEPQIERFWSMVNKGPDCWEWSVSQKGVAYPRFWINDEQGKRWYSCHRLAYFISTGTDPEELFVCHSCDNGWCCRPEHLFLGTHTDNMRDCASKDRRTHTALTNDIVSDARLRCAKGEYVSEVAKEYGVNYKNLSNAVKEGWSHLETPPVPDAKVKKYRKANKLSRQDYEEIVEALKKPYWGQVNDLAKKYGCGHPLISHIKTGRWAPSSVSIRE